MRVAEAGGECRFRYRFEDDGQIHSVRITHSNRNVRMRAKTQRSTDSAITILGVEPGAAAEQPVSRRQVDTRVHSNVVGVSEAFEFRGR